MTDERSLRPTRRDYIRGGGALIGGGLLAGCTGNDSGSTSASSESTRAATEAAATESSETTESGSADSWTVSMAPMGDVEFTAVPENAMVYSLLYADMAVAYGHGDAVNSLGFNKDVDKKTLDAFLEPLDGVSFDAGGLKQLNSGSNSVNIDKERFYELDSDVHLVDPCLVMSFDGWERSDVDEITENVAPFFGNSYSRAHSQPPEECRDHYEYYTLWEISEKVSRVFRESKRYEALSSVHDGLVRKIQSNLPPEKERPTVGTIIFMDGTFYPSKLNAPGFSTAHTRPMGAKDAFTADDVTYETSYDYETVLEVDPDVLLHSYGIASYYNVDDIRKTLEDDSVGSELKAVKNDRVYPSGNPTQGPIMNLFQLEMTAKQLYPEQFGEWPDYASGDPYPDIPEGEQLFDRQKVADIVNGNA